MYRKKRGGINLQSQLSHVKKHVMGRDESHGRPKFKKDSKSPITGYGQGRI
jgi:hypothetical protein